MAKTYRVGIVCGSQRVVRAGPQITAFVSDVIKAVVAAKRGLADGGTDAVVLVETETVDVATLGLPLFDEPGVPSQIQSADGYAHEHTRVWSRRVAALDAFVFVTPQYNWGIPAGLKNALDYLYNEWTGKPALVISYGGHGGDKAAAALQTVLNGLRMRVVEQAVHLTFPGRATLVTATQGHDLGLDAADDSPDRTWSDRRGDIVQGWEQLVHLLEAGSKN